MDVDETPVTRGSLDGNAVNDAGTTKDPDLSVLEDEEEKDNEFAVERSGILNPVDDGTDTLPTDVHMEKSGPISQEPVDVVTGTNANTENIAAIDRKPELIRIETADDHVKTEGEVHENVDQVITTLNAEVQNTDYSSKWSIDTQIGAADISGTIEEQAAFMKELERFHIERALDFKPTKFYVEPLNCLKLWRLVIMLGGYDHALLQYERHEIQAGLQLPVNSMPMQMISAKEAGQAVGSHKAHRDSSSRAVKGQRRMVTTVIGVRPPADWVKVSVQENKDCFEIYALVPGLFREEVRVQSDPAGQLVITGQPEQLENPWGITPFKKDESKQDAADPSSKTREA